MTENIELLLKALERMGTHLMTEGLTDGEKAIAFATVDNLVDRLEALNQSANGGKIYVTEKLVQILSFASSLAGLHDDTNPEYAKMNYAEKISALRSGIGFGVGGITG